MIESNSISGLPYPLRVQQFLNELRCADWNALDGPMRLSSKVAMEDLAGAAFFANARLLLTALAAEDGTAATVAGNLNRAFVGGLFDQLVMDERTRDSLRRVCKVINETDTWALHLARIVVECAGLIRRRAKRYTVTTIGRKLLAEDQAGGLYRALFIAYFRKFDLTYDFHLRPVPEIQETMAAILWRLDAVARDWIPVRNLAARILLPRVHERSLAAMTHPAHDTEEWILGGHVLWPLTDLGLLERRDRGGWRLFEAEDEIRQTRLWRKFIWFDWQP